MNNAIICDIDGTLAIRGKRGPFEHEKSNEDQVFEPVKNLLKIYKNQNYHILILTGRQERFKDITIKWLQTNNIEYDSIYFRETNDQRKDSIVKMDIYNTHIADVYNVEFILDDRDQVVDMWRNNLKLNCFQVNYGNF